MDCDRISELPDSLVAQILSYLPTKDCVKTSVLSRSWECRWLHVSELDLNAIDFLPQGKSALPNCMEKFLKFNIGSCLQKFKIKYHKGSVAFPFDGSQGVMEWIAEVVHRGVQHLEVEKETSEIKSNVDFMPKYMYVSKTLVSLKLVNVGLEYPKFDVSLPHLKKMHLEKIFYEGYGLLIMQRLLSASTVLEDLTMDVPVSWKPREIILRKAPRCLSKTLVYVKINKLTREGTGIKLVKYFLKNSAVLKKLTLSSTHLSTINQKSLDKMLLTATKLAPTLSGSRRLTCSFL